MCMSDLCRRSPFSDLDIFGNRLPKSVTQTNALMKTFSVGTCLLTCRRMYDAQSSLPARVMIDLANKLLYYYLFGDSFTFFLVQIVSKLKSSSNQYIVTWVEMRTCRRKYYWNDVTICFVV